VTDSGEVLVEKFKSEVQDNATFDPESAPQFIAPTEVSLIATDIVEEVGEAKAALTEILAFWEVIAGTVKE
jgi:hypothetical protein